MKVEWQFLFHAVDFRFEKDHIFKGSVDQEPSAEDAEPKPIVFDVRLSPTEDRPPQGVEQIGWMYLCLMGTPEKTKSLAIWLSQKIAENINFQGNTFRINHGFVAGKRIPENKTEEDEFGETPYFAEAHLEEVLPPATFDPDGLTGIPKQAHSGLIAQFNSTKSDSDTIRKFLGFFKILEGIYQKSRNTNLKNSLKGSRELRAIYEAIGVQMTFDAFVDKIVDIRHKTAHLRLSENYGYLPDDPDLKEEVEPLIPVLSELAFHCVMKNPSKK